VFHNVTIVGNGVIPHFHAEPMAQNARSAVVLINLNTIETWHSVVKLTPKLTFLDSRPN